MTLRDRGDVGMFGASRDDPALTVPSSVQSFLQSEQCRELVGF